MTSGVKLIVISMSSPDNNVMGKLEFRLKLLLKILPDSSMRSPSPRLLTFKIYSAVELMPTSPKLTLEVLRFISGVPEPNISIW